MKLKELLKRVKQLGGTILVRATDLDLRPPSDNPVAAQELQALVPLLLPWRELILRMRKVSPRTAGDVALQVLSPIRCDLCRSDWFCSTAEVKQLAADPHWCSRGGSPPVRKPDGRIVRSGEPRCPFKQHPSGVSR